MPSLIHPSLSQGISSITSRATIQLFSYIQNNYGGLKILLDDQSDPQKPAILTRTDGQIHTKDLQKLMTHECSAIHVKNFYHARTASEIGKELSDQAIIQGMARNWKVSTARGLESSDVSTLGCHAPFNVVAGSISSKKYKSNQEEKTNRKEMNSQRNEGSVGGKESNSEQNLMDDYFKGVQKELHDRRWQSIDNFNDTSSDSNQQQQKQIVPRLWPLDKLRLELDEAWPEGAGLAREKGELQRPFSGGLPRVMVGPTRWKKGFIHVDEMAPLSPNNGLFSANIYLQLPEEGKANPSAKKKEGIDEKDDGGSLHIWPLRINSRWDWYKNAFLLSGLSTQDPAMQIRLRKELGDPLVLQITPGDLVLLCVQRPHAVVGFKDGIRVSLQCFIQHNKGERLLIDS